MGKKMNTTHEMLEFDKIIEKLKNYTVTERAGERFDAMNPILNESELRVRMKETTEARKILDVHGSPPFSQVNNIRKLTESADRGELLTVDELQNVSQFAILSMRLKRYLNQSEELGLVISEYGRGMSNLEPLKEEIERCIRSGKIDDYASKELKDVRRKIERTMANIRLKLENLLKSKKEYFSESFVSNRNGHYTLPVKREYKLQVSGSVIDVSASGATYFIEPVSVAKLKEELNELMITESNEERKILYTLASFVNDYKNDILLNLDYIEELDYIFAKGKLSVEIQGKEPGINTERYVRIVNGRHPLISKKECIPLNIEFGKDIKGVVITGPNTGGKTVALKTVGLFSIMAQCGLHISCEEADICMNTQVLCDIGDRQSILENLSTFSAHIKTVIDIMKWVEKDSLVLMDELGSGTDPTEGMGIAIAILEELRQSNCNFITTTHYPEVKVYAEKAGSIINARMAFDRESLKPLYQLEMGEAGESCALYIAKRLGLPENMLKRAYEATYHKKDGNIAMDFDFLNEEKKDNGPNKPDILTDKIQKTEAPKQINTRAQTFQIGDSVMVYPQKKLGIIFEKANTRGELGVQIQKNKIYVNHRRLQLKASAKDLYPDNYDFSIIFDSVENRKARHKMEKRHMEGLVIRYEKE